MISSILAGPGWGGCCLHNPILNRIRGETETRVFRGKSITIVCTDTARSAAFYRGVLGADLLPGDGYGCPWYRLGDLVFSLVANAATPSTSSPSAATLMLWLEVDDLPAAHRRLAEAGVRIVEAPEGGPYVLIADPDGLLIEVWEPNA
jgi:catechol 2,3-dioxygenase-like lactoylglutathione lyase family enzyme